MKLVPLYSDHLPSAEQDAICCTITKLALCLAEFEFVSNPHINLIDKPSAKLHNHSLCTIVLAYHHNEKKTFLSIDHDHNSGQVILTYPRQYCSEANGCAHHLVKYMEYKNGTPALRWFNYLGLAAANDMEWNAAEGQPIPKSEAALMKLATMEFDWLDCPDLNQVEDVTQPAMCAEDLSVVIFDKDHKPSVKPAGNDNSLATAQASINSTSGSTSGPPPHLALSKVPPSWFLWIWRLMTLPPWQIWLPLRKTQITLLLLHLQPLPLEAPPSWS